MMSWAEQLGNPRIDGDYMVLMCLERWHSSLWECHTFLTKSYTKSNGHQTESAAPWLYSRYIVQYELSRCNVPSICKGVHRRSLLIMETSLRILPWNLNDF